MDYFSHHHLFLTLIVLYLQHVLLFDTARSFINPSILLFATLYIIFEIYYDTRKINIPGGRGQNTIIIILLIYFIIQIPRAIHSIFLYAVLKHFKLYALLQIIVIVHTKRV
jgi:hypothetical protein